MPTFWSGYSDFLQDEDEDLRPGEDQSTLLFLSYMIVGDSSYLSKTACWGEQGTSEEKSIK